MRWAECGGGVNRRLWGDGVNRRLCGGRGSRTGRTGSPEACPPHPRGSVPAALGGPREGARTQSESLLSPRAAPQGHSAPESISDLVCVVTSFLSTGQETPDPLAFAFSLLTPVTRQPHAGAGLGPGRTPPLEQATLWTLRAV